MKTEEAIEICEKWLDHIEAQKQRATEVQKVAAMARTGQQEEAQRRLRQIDNSVTVYDGARMEPAIRHLVDIARKSGI